MKITYNEALKEIRAEARNVGLVFKKLPATADRNRNYHFVDKNTKEIVLSLHTIWGAYEFVCSGYIASYDSKTGYFAGVNFYK